jgi:hypothetical protein
MEGRDWRARAESEGEYTALKVDERSWIGNAV